MSILHIMEMGLVMMETITKGVSLMVVTVVDLMSTLTIAQNVNALK